MAICIDITGPMVVAGVSGGGNPYGMSAVVVSLMGIVIVLVMRAVVVLLMGAVVMRGVRVVVVPLVASFEHNFHSSPAINSLRPWSL